MDKALGSDDVDKLVWVLTCTRSSSAFANRRPQYSVPKNKIFVKYLCIFYLTAMKYQVYFFQKLLKLLLIMNKNLELQVINVAANQKM